MCRSISLETGATYVALPNNIQAILYKKNTDMFSALWSILASFYPVPSNQHSAASY